MPCRDCQLLLAYSDEAETSRKSVTFMSELIGVGGVATVGLFGVLASALNLQKSPQVTERAKADRRRKVDG